MIGVDSHLGVVEEDLQPQTAFQCVMQRLGQGTLGQQVGAFAARTAPLPERLDDRSDMSRSILAFCGANEGVVADLLLVTVHRTDEGQGLGHRLGLGFFGSFKAASRMAPALRMDDLPGAGARIGCIPWSPRAASCHPKGRSEAKELRDMNRLSVLEVNGPQMQYWTFEVDERRALLNSRTSMQ